MFYTFTALIVFMGEYTMANKIKFKRGLKSKLPTLEAGEPAFLTDTRELLIGTGSGNVNISGQRAATYIVAASNSVHKETADYICDGTADEVEINAAIAALPSGGGKVLLLEGTYKTSAAITINKNNVVLSGVCPTAINDGVINISGNNCHICYLKVKQIVVSGTSNEIEKCNFCCDDQSTVILTGSENYIHNNFLEVDDTYDDTYSVKISGANASFNVVENNNGFGGMCIAGAPANIIRNNQMYGSWGVKITNGDSNVICNNILISNSTYLIDNGTNTQSYNNLNVEESMPV